MDEKGQKKPRKQCELCFEYFESSCSLKTHRETCKTKEQQQDKKEQQEDKKEQQEDKKEQNQFQCELCYKPYRKLFYFENHKLVCMIKKKPKEQQQDN